MIWDGGGLINGSTISSTSTSLEFQSSYINYVRGQNTISPYREETIGKRLLWNVIIEIISTKFEKLILYSISYSYSNLKVPIKQFWRYLSQLTKSACQIFGATVSYRIVSSKLSLPLHKGDNCIRLQVRRYPSHINIGGGGGHWGEEKLQQDLDGSPKKEEEPSLFPFVIILSLLSISRNW